MKMHEADIPSIEKMRGLQKNSKCRETIPFSEDCSSFKSATEGRRQKRNFFCFFSFFAFHDIKYFELLYTFRMLITARVSFAAEMV